MKNRALIATGGACVFVAFAAYSQADLLLGNREAQPWPIQAVFVKEDREKLICRPASIAEHIIKVRPLQQAQLPGEVLLVFGRGGSWLRGD